MTTSGLGAPLVGDGHFENARATWERLRTWEYDHWLWSGIGIVAVILAFSFAISSAMFDTDWTDNCLQVLIVVPLIWRRKAPLPVFAVIAALCFAQWLVAVPLPADIALLVALFTVAVHDPPRRAFLAALVLELGVVMASLRWSPAGDTAKSIILLSGTGIAALFVGLTLKTWRAYLETLVETTKRLEFERDQQARLAAAAERSRIAREMHDVVAHNVSIMVTLADGARATSSPDKAREVMGEVSAVGRLALTDMRQLLGVLQDTGDESERAPQPELAGLPKLIDGVRATGLAVELTELGASFEITPGAELTIYRIVQESLTNVLKHADRPSKAEVRLVFEEPFVALSVRDNGRHPVRAGRGHGLGGMKERAASFGGALSAGPGSDGGWEVTSRIKVDIESVR
jgi:signal transduction histidine kinase